MSTNNFSNDIFVNSLDSGDSEKAFSKPTHLINAAKRKFIYQK